MSRALAAVALITLSIPSFAGSCRLNVAWDPYEPYSFASSGSTPEGFDIDVVTRIAAMIGCSLSWSEMEWSEVLDAIREGKVDLAVGTGYRQERADWSWYTESYRQEVIGIVVRKGGSAEFPGESLAELFASGFVFGKTTGDSYDAESVRVFARFPGQVKPPVGEADNLARLLDEAIDGFLIEINVAAALIRRQDAASMIEFHPLSFTAGQYRLQASKKTVDAARLAAINEAIQRLAADGWLEATLAGYGIGQAPETAQVLP